MQQGIIRSYEQSSGVGFISNPGNMDIMFNSANILGRDRTQLKQGDSVWFEMENIQNNNVAVNIRKCI